MFHVKVRWASIVVLGAALLTTSALPAEAATAKHPSGIEITPSVQDQFFGSSVAISGSTAVVGAQHPPAAYVFVERGRKWVQQARLTPADGALNGAFGTSVAISGSTVGCG